MFELEKTEEVKELIAITKSDSGVSGPRLAKAHMRLGGLVAEHLPELNPLYFALGCRLETYDPKHQKFERPGTKNVILVDSVINTGKTIRDILAPDMYVACCVINERAVPAFSDMLYTARVSRNFYVGEDVKRQSGGIGPDTTMRLFNQL